MSNHEIEEMLDENFESLYLKCLQQNFSHFHMLDVTIEKGGFSQTKKNMISYGLKQENTQHTINNFHQLGWFDPFPQSLPKGTKVEVKINQDTIKQFKKKTFKSNIKRFKKDAFFTDGSLIYNRKRNLEELSPMCVYIPSKELMFKMMRACIGCEKPQDLWIYNN